MNYAVNHTKIHPTKISAGDVGDLISGEVHCHCYMEAHSPRQPPIEYFAWHWEIKGNLQTLDQCKVGWDVCSPVPSVCRIMVVHSVIL